MRSITTLVSLALALPAHSFLSLQVRKRQYPNTRNVPCLQSQSQPQQPKEDIRLQPFLPAADPEYRNNGPIGQASFVVFREGDVRQEELTNENMLKIVEDECSDLEVNTLVWRALGYKFQNGTWDNTQVFPKWREKFPSPPDLIGMQRIFSKAIDEPCMRANQQLVRSIPQEHKQQLRKHLRPMGFMGFKIAELTPNKTRRAQCANWLLYYRDHLFGYTIDELRAKREKEAPKKEAVDEWKAPVKEVF